MYRKLKKNKEIFKIKKVSQLSYKHLGIDLKSVLNSQDANETFDTQNRSLSESIEYNKEIKLQSLNSINLSIEKQ